MPAALVDGNHAGPSSRIGTSSSPSPVEDATSDGDGDGGGDSDWLLSDEEDEHEYDKPRGHGHERDEDTDGDATLVPVTHTHLHMANRDSAKVQRVFYDTGYREGITAGKLSTLQAGFDTGFNETVPVARTRGILRGQANAVRVYLTEYRSSTSNKRGTNARASANVPTPSSPHHHLTTCRKLLSTIDALNTDSLLEPDWDAKRHDLEHSGQDENDPRTVVVLSETDEQRRMRTKRLGEVGEAVDGLVRDVLR